jgi:2-(1,2-epoxy-1,2-dihydrophenyl)acetyl-CoA isomerase
VSYETIDLDIRDQVAWVTLNRPKSFNALNAQMAKELCDLSIRLGEDREVRAVVLTGAGDQAFCAGGDVQGFADNADEVSALLKEMTTYLHMAISRLAWMRAPVIAAVNGVAAGAGLSFVAATDLAVAADTARFTSAYTQIGLSPDGSSTYFLPRIIGTRRTAELYLTNRVLSPAEALDWGLVNQVVPAAELTETVEALAGKLAKGATEAHGMVKKLLLMSPNDTLESQMERETRGIAALGRTADAREGFDAFVNKRKPEFTGS